MIIAPVGVHVRWLSDQHAVLIHRIARQIDAQIGPGRDLSRLYRLALDMGSCTTYEELARTVLDGLLEAIAAEVGAILTMKEGEELDLQAVLAKLKQIGGKHEEEEE